MPKYFLCIFFLFILPGESPLFSQAVSDSVEMVEVGPDHLISPVADTGYSKADPIRQVPGEQVKVYLKNPDYAYANNPSYWEKEAPQNPGYLNRFLNSRLLAWFLLLAVTGIVFYGIYLLAKENSFSWFTGNTNKIISETDDHPDDHKQDYDGLIRKYQEEGNYRMAVRYMYLRLIHTAGKKGGIPFRASSTNAEILRAFGNHPQAGEFRILARAYEYIFYGGFLPEQELFDTLKNKFEAFQQTLTA
jgi:hypothetical protein